MDYMKSHFPKRIYMQSHFPEIGKRIYWTAEKIRPDDYEVRFRMKREPNKYETPDVLSNAVVVIYLAGFHDKEKLNEYANILAQNWSVCGYKYELISIK